MAGKTPAGAATSSCCYATTPVCNLQGILESWFSELQPHVAEECHHQRQGRSQLGQAKLQEQSILAPANCAFQWNLGSPNHRPNPRGCHPHVWVKGIWPVQSALQSCPAPLSSLTNLPSVKVWQRVNDSQKVSVSGAQWTNLLDVRIWHGFAAGAQISTGLFIHH